MAMVKDVIYPKTTQLGQRRIFYTGRPTD